MKKISTESESWIEEHYFHCNDLTLERDFIEEQLPLVESLLAEGAEAEVPTALNMPEQINIAVCESLKKLFA